MLCFFLLPFILNLLIPVSYTHLDVYKRQIEHTLDQNNPSQFETKSNDYTLINFGLGGKVTIGKTAFDVNLNANNLFDKTYISHLSRLKTDGIPNIGRNIMMGINFTI